MPSGMPTTNATMQGVERQLEGGGAVGQQHLDAPAVVAERRAEVAGEDLAEVFEVLHDDRPVVAGGGDALGELVGAEPAAEGGGDRVAGRAHEHEHQRHQDEDRRDDQEETDEEIAPEFPPSRLRRARWGGLRRRCLTPASGDGQRTQRSTCQSQRVQGDPVCRPIALHAETEDWLRSDYLLGQRRVAELERRVER